MSDDVNWKFPPEETAAPDWVVVSGVVVRAGDRVRLHPGRRSAQRQGVLTDAMDMMLDGKTARVEDIQQDYENRIYLVVSLDDDPGREPFDERLMPGHRFFFFLEEVEPLEATAREDS